MSKEGYGYNELGIMRQQFVGLLRGAGKIPLLIAERRA
jgi:hypothetical protein